MKKALFIVITLFLIAVGAFAQATNALKVTPDGKVGIGTDTPDAKLEVNGRIKDKTGVVMPVGTVLAFAGPLENIPEGWLICDGSSLNRADVQYTDLFAVIGTSWGAPDENTFNVPDLRGMFLRGVAGDAVTDPDKDTRNASKDGGNTGNDVGSVQEDEFANHNHSIDTKVHGSQNQYYSNKYKLIGDGETVTSSEGGNETRPVNVYVYYIIKY